MSNNVICRGGRASTLAPLLPRFVTTKPAFESLESDFRTNVGSAFTLSARVTEDIASPWWNPSAAMMCAATANWRLFADITAPAQYVMLNSIIRLQSFMSKSISPDSVLREWRTPLLLSESLCGLCWTRCAAGASRTRGQWRQKSSGPPIGCNETMMLDKGDLHVSPR